ncbi:hypothetical protein TcWFU_010210 [Taenia crassiceps]|uniref:BZIP domain-containing protein n=1 Tax=Taenia crassiceps TaxID=6207 RepID=A0ABR4QMX9_9CEST
MENADSVAHVHSNYPCNSQNCPPLFTDSFSAFYYEFLFGDHLQHQPPSTINPIRNSNCNVKPLPRLELAVSETESETSSSFSSYSMLQASSPPLTHPSCECNWKAFNGPLGIQEGQKKSPVANFVSKNHQNYEEREIRRKERNNAASRKSRALRKRRFQQMLLETERLTNSNARLRALVEELNSIMAESKAILFEKFTISVTPDASTAAQQPMPNLGE